MANQSRPLFVWMNHQQPVAVAEVWSLLAAGLRFLAQYHRHDLVYGSLSPGIFSYDHDKWQVAAVSPVSPDPEYIAPEQLQGQACLGSDLYSLGLMVLQLLTGKPPFSFFPLSPDQLITEPFANLHSPDRAPISPSDQALNHRSLRLFLQKLIHPEPSQRFANALVAYRQLPKSEQYNYPLLDLEELPSSVTQDHSVSQLKLNHRWHTVSELVGHGGYVPQINAISFWGQERLISASDDHTLKVWHWPSAICEQTLQEHTSFVKALAVAPNGQYCASGGADGRLIVHQMTHQTHDVDAPQINLHWAINAHNQGITAIVFTQDSGQIITTSADKSVCVWSIADGSLLHRCNAHDLGILCLALSANGRYIATGSSDRTLKIWEIVPSDPNADELKNIGELKLVQQIRQHTWGVSAVAFSPDGQWLASGGQDNQIYVWSMAQVCCQRPVKQMLQTTINGHSWTITTLIFTNDHQLWSASWDKTIKCWDIPQGHNLTTLTGHTNSVSALAWQQNQNCLGSASYDATVRLWQN